MLESVNDMVRNKMVDGTELSERSLSGKAKGGTGKGPYAGKGFDVYTKGAPKAGGKGGKAKGGGKGAAPQFGSCWTCGGGQPARKIYARASISATEWRPATQYRHPTQWQQRPIYVRAVG